MNGAHAPEITKKTSKYASPLSAVPAMPPPPKEVFSMHVWTVCEGVLLCTRCSVVHNVPCRDQARLVCLQECCMPCVEQVCWNLMLVGPHSLTNRPLITRGPLLTYWETNIAAVGTLASTSLAGVEYIMTQPHYISL